MKVFSLKLLLFFLPFAAVMGGAASIMVYTGEATPLSVVVAQQMGDTPVLYRPWYGNRDFDFKLLATETRQPDILVLGSSRVLQFRAMFFSQNPDAFYNAAAPAWTLDSVDTFLANLKFNPPILILGLDHPWFNADFVGEALPPRVTDLEQVFAAVSGILKDRLLGRDGFDIEKMLARREPGYGSAALGFRAIRDGHGFRNDGSEQYGDFLVAKYLAPDLERGRHLEWMRQGEKMYVRGAHVDEARFAQLEAILRRCQERGIFVIGLSPMFMPSLYEEMMAGGQHRYMAELVERLPALFDRYGFAYFDFSNGTWLGGQDTDFFDGWHGSEMLYTLMYIRMVEALPGRLGPYSDGNALYGAIASADSTFNVFGNRFK